MTEKDKHSKLGASSCERWWNCPGSIALIEQAPEQPESVYAAEGTAAHFVAAGMLGAIAPYTRGPVINAPEVPVTPEMLEAINVYVDYVNEIKSKYKLKPWHIKVEQQVSISGHPDLYGTADCIIYVPYNRLIVIDFKYGAGVQVPVAGNKQVLYYALGAWNSLLKEEQEGIDKIELVIIQPRTPGGSIDSYFVHPDALAKFHKELINAVNRTIYSQEHVRPTLVAGDHCKFCPAKTICPAFKEMITEGAGDDFKGLLLPKPIAPTLPIELEPSRLAKILAVEDLALSWFKDARAYAMRLAEQGVEIPGYKLVEKYGNRKWKDEKQFEKYLYPVYENLIYKRQLLSPAQMEKMMKTQEQQYDISVFIEKPLNGKTLVPITDKRPDICGEITDFDGVIE